MIVTHTISNPRCLSNIIFPAIHKGWKDSSSTINFFWGFVSLENPKVLKEIEERGEEWWFIDCGYLTEQITRYPNPIIHDYHKTYFRIVRKNFHTQLRGSEVSINAGMRKAKLDSQGINTKFNGWKKNGEKVLLCPSSPTVTRLLHNKTQEQWCENAVNEIGDKQNIKFRNKPRPENEWWGTKIEDDLQDCRLTITDMSLSSVDSILNGVPVICNHENVANCVAKGMQHDEKKVNNWIENLADHQFTVPEITNGAAYDFLHMR